MGAFSKMTPFDHIQENIAPGFPLIINSKFLMLAENILQVLGSQRRNHQRVNRYNLANVGRGFYF